MLSLLQPILSTRMFEEQEEAGDLTDSEESVYSGLEDSGSDSLTEDEKDQDYGAEEKPKGKLHSRNSQVSWSSLRLVMLCFCRRRTASKLAGTALKNWGWGRIPALPACPSGSLWNLFGFCFRCNLEPTKHVFCYCQTTVHPKYLDRISRMQWLV